MVRREILRPTVVLPHETLLPFSLTESMSDFTVRAHGAMLTLHARTERARIRIARLQAVKSADQMDRLLVNRERAREIVEQLKFERYSVEGEELI